MADNEKTLKDNIQQKVRFQPERLCLQNQHNQETEQAYIEFFMLDPDSALKRSITQTGDVLCRLFEYD